MTEPEIVRGYEGVALEHSKKLSSQVLEQMGAQGISRADLSRKLGISRPAVSKIFNKDNYSFKTIAKLEQALDCKFDFQFKKDEDS